MRKPTQLDPKDDHENDLLTFDFSTKTLPGETIVGIPSFECEAVTGVDPLAINLLSGPSQITGNQVIQRVVGGIIGVTYRIHCIAVFTPTNRVLTLTGLLPVGKL